MDFKKSLVSFSYSLASSKRYKAYKDIARDILEEENSPQKRYFDIFMIVLVLTTIVIFIYEIKHDLHPIFFTIEVIAVIIFIIEWLGRFWVSSDSHQMVIERYEKAQMRNRKITTASLIKEIALKKLKFVFSPMSIIDLLAILPAYRPLRFLRFFLIFRLFKIFRYTQNMNFLMKVFVEKKFEFLTLIILFSFLVFFSSTVIYIFEGVGENKNINTFYDAIYWAVVTITTVGYGDISPVTPEGRFATILLIMSGLGIIAFTTSIVTTAMTEKLEQIKENNILSQASKLKDFVLICGYGKMGKVFASELQFEKENFVVIDLNREAVNKATEKGYLALCADASDIEVLKSLNSSKNAKYVLAITNVDALNLSIILSVKSLNPDLDIIARANLITSRKKLKIAGAKRVLFPYESSGKAAVEYFLQPIVYDSIDKILQDRVGPIADEIEIFLDDKNSTKIIKKELLTFYGLKLLGISKKGKFIFNPNNEEFEVRNLDILIVVGFSDDIAYFKVALIKG